MAETFHRCGVVCEGATAPAVLTDKYPVHICACRDQTPHLSHIHPTCHLVHILLMQDRNRPFGKQSRRIAHLIMQKYEVIRAQALRLRPSPRSCTLGTITSRMLMKSQQEFYQSAVECGAGTPVWGCLPAALHGPAPHRLQGHPPAEYLRTQCVTGASEIHPLNNNR